MGDNISIQMMGQFTIYVNGKRTDMSRKSRKGMALMQYLIMNRNAAVDNRRLLDTFWIPSGRTSGWPIPRER